MLRIGSVEGTVSGKEGCELIYPLGNAAATELYIAQFKGFYSQSNTMVFYFIIIG